MADYLYIREQGVVVPDTTETRAEVEQEYRDIFGIDVQLEPSTPLGVIAARTIETRDSVARNNAELANQINPDIAGGVFLDAIAALSGISRPYQTHTRLKVRFSGTPGVIVPKGTRLMEDSGNIFVLDANYTISTPSSWGWATAVEGGAIPLPYVPYMDILDPVLGATSVVVSLNGTIGQDGQSDAQFRAYRRSTLALQATGGVAAIRARVEAVSGVKQAIVAENATDAGIEWKGETIPPHSIWCIVDGGSVSDIGEAIIAAKSPGCSMFAPEDGRRTYTKSTESIVATVVWTASFGVTVKVRIRIKDRDRWLDQVTQAVTAYAAGEVDGAKPGGIGQDLSPWEISGAINQMHPQITVTGVELSLDGVHYSSEVLETSQGYYSFRIDTENIEVV